jgi:hypothetical protein
MWEIGARNEVVGVSQYASYLEGADGKANVSGPSGPSVEAVLATGPDLVLVPSSSYGAAEERIEQLRAQGVPVSSVTVCGNEHVSEWLSTTAGCLSAAVSSFHPTGSGSTSGPWTPAVASAGEAAATPPATGPTPIAAATSRTERGHAWDCIHPSERYCNKYLANPTALGDVP